MNDVNCSRVPFGLNDSPGSLNGRSKVTVFRERPEATSRQQPSDQDSHAKSRRVDQKILKASVPRLQLDLGAFNEGGECY
ncbi:hypothetical protein [Bradyrhizobium jicamae]|uniref:hypothetical protein n=1 Tax=Bradyrhizobium jicamae TaxID=280332 RepID=UPI001BA5131D|nr:hypothetical protein [Bradyrhizobium jicamae]MBR0935670.1 hypothetical protein [Bradyrhizobium jicamae]